MDRLLAVIVAAVLLTGCNDDTRKPPTVFIGDSIIAHWNLPIGINAGVGGEITAQMLARFDADVLALKPGIVVIEGGVNDLVSVIGPNPANVEEMASRAAASGARVILLSVLPATIPYDIGAWNDELRLIAAANGYAYVDFDPIMKDASGVQKLSLYDADGVHPTQAAYDELWQQLTPALVKASW